MKLLKKIDDFVEYHREMAYIGKVVDQLKKHRKLPAGMAGLSIPLDEDYSDAIDVDISQEEYAAIRKYLLKRRVAWLRKEGVEV